MIHIDQVRTLELKVKQAVQLIVHLRKENDHLRGRLADTEVRLQELEDMLQSLKASQNEIESGIKNALEELDHIEGAAAPVESAAEVEVRLSPAPGVSAVVEEEGYADESELIGHESDPFEESFLDEAAGEEVPVAAEEKEDESQPGLGIF